MNTPRTLVTITMIFGFLTICGGPWLEAGHASEDVPNVVTADIEAGIEAHIEEQTRKGNGYFTLPFQGRQLRMKLVRVHTEYLANLGPRRHFACVDLASTDGNLYDVDFFLAGDAGEMTVTETTVHKINGQPIYLWKQNRKGTWVRAPVENASHDLLGVIRGRDEFEFRYEATLPRIDGTGRMWVPIPASDDYQTVEIKSIDTPGRREIVRDPVYGNKAFFMRLGPEDSGERLTIRFSVQRKEKSAYAADEPDPDRYLTPDRLVPKDERFDSIVEEVLEGKKGDLVRARAIYDHVIDRMRYIKFGSGWGRGDAIHACDIQTGNCTDFHAYFIALARAAGIPARFAIGAAVPSERNSGGVNGYHCWAEFYADGKWWPVDISEADKYSSLATYYFGHHPANRVEFSRGRDLVFDPGPASGPINFLAYPVLEIDGKPVRPKVQFSFRRRQSRAK